jgi:predicted Rossmann fold flavoprotein
MQAFDAIVLGAGAAGLMCAIEAGRRGRRVLLLDHADRIGKKILISGGGRCNFTNLHTTAENYLSENPHFARSALARYTPADFIAKVEEHNIPYHEKTLGQLFCDRTSRDIVDLLARECAEAKVRIQLETSIQSVAANGVGGFTVETSAGVFRAESVVVATGGLSIPKMGATSFGYDVARQFGLRVVECRPGLVALTFSAEDRDRWCDLAGVSAEVIASAPPRSRKSGQASFREKLLVTHRGLSGPAVLQISSFWSAGETLRFDLAPDREVLAPLREANAPRDATAALAALRGTLPGRWAERWMSVHAPPVRTLSNAALAALEEQLHAWPVLPAGTEGYAKAEVTAGGVSTAELDPRTLEARRVPGLFFIGEVVDVTGWLGGYNFQWAWASGYCAGQAA